MHIIHNMLKEVNKKGRINGWMNGWMEGRHKSMCNNNSCCQFNYLEPTYVPTYLPSVSQSVSRSDDQREQRIHVGILLHRIQRRLYYRENRRRCGNDKMKSVRYFY